MKKAITTSKIFALIDSYLPPLLWAGMIFFLSNQSSLASFESSPLDFIFKKAAHIGVYAVLFFLINRALYKRHRKIYNHKQKWLLPVFICLLYAVSDEIHQSYIPGRFATLRDIGYDGLGVLIAFMQKYRYI